MTWIFPKQSGGGGTVTSVTAADTSIVVGGTAAAPTVRTNTLDVIAADHAPAADWSNNSHKITSVAVATAATDAASLANTLDQFGAPAANVAFNAKKITGIANGSAATDALAVGQVLAAGAIPIADLVDPTTGKVIGSSGGAAAAIFPPGHKWDSASITSPVSVTGTSEGSPTTCITGNSITYDGTEVKIEVFSPLVIGASLQNMFIVLLRDSAVLGRSQVNSNSVAGAFEQEVLITAYDTPSAAAHTYSVVAFMSSGTGTFSAGAGGAGNFLPATLRVTKT